MKLQQKISIGGNKYSARKEITEQLRIRQSFERKLNLSLLREFEKIGRLAKTEYNLRQSITVTNSAVSQTLNNILEPHYRAVIDEFGLRMTRYRKQESQFEILIREYYAAFGLTAVTNISNTTVNRLTKVMLAMEAEGLGVAVIADEIFQSMRGAFSRNRAAVIARTETHNAASFANHEVAKSMNIPNLQKQWVAVSDDRTRSNHAIMNGTRVPMDEDFDVPSTLGTRRMSRPSDPRGGAENVINCRCVLMYVTPEDDVVDD